MEAQDTANEIVAAAPVEAKKSPPLLPPASFSAGVRPAQGAAPCPTCGAGVASAIPGASYVYVLGQIEERYPRPSVEKEVAQVTGRAETAGRTDRQALYQVLSQRENRYLARQLCWVLCVQGIETYLLQPRDPMDLDLLINALEPHSPPWISTVIGVQGPVAPPDYCNGLMLPIVVFDQIYTFSRESLIGAIPRPEFDTGASLRAGGERTVRPDHADDRQRRFDRPRPGAELLRGALSRHLRQDGGGVWSEFVALGR